LKSLNSTEYTRVFVASRLDMDAEIDRPGMHRVRVVLRNDGGSGTESSQ
jgi:hypothetical protein